MASSSTDQVSSGAVLAPRTLLVLTEMSEERLTSRGDGLHQAARALEAAADVGAPLGATMPAFQMLAEYLRIAAAGFRAESGL